MRTIRLPERFRSITGDFIVNIAASVIYTFARQLVVFPLLASRLAESDYGLLLTVAGLANVCVAVTGGALNNIRLIRNSSYEEAGVSGDFNLLCALGCAVSSLTIFVWLFVFHLSVLTASLLTVYISVSAFYQYAAAFYRLELNFRRILVCNIAVSCAYIAATPLFATNSLWPAVFIAGEGVGLVYVSRTTPLLKEPFSGTPLLKETGKTFAVFIGMNLIGNLLLYADRMLIYPVLGSESVAYYSVASFFGKSAGIIMTPIAGVLLGYFAQKNFKASKKLFAAVNGLSLACLFLFLIFCRFAAPYATALIYPSLYAPSAPYIALANLGAVLSIAGNMAQPMVLKACPIRWSFFTQLLYASSYILFSFMWMRDFGLAGFCWAAIASNAVRLLFLYAVGFAKF